MNSMDATLQAQLNLRREEHLYRTRLNVASGCSSTLSVEGRSLINFCSNDYLGLASHPDISLALKQAADLYGTGSGASHLVSGHSVVHQKLEEQLAQYTGRPRALLFSTGYMANMGVINALVGRRDLVLQDQLNHASLLDGGRLSQADFKRYKHVDMASLEQRLEQSSAERKLIVSDGVFSMDGNLAPLSEISTLAKKHNAWLMVDDAHGVGVLGPQGGGLVEQLGMNLKQVPVLVGTLGKSFGTFGAFVAGSEALIETLIQFSRSYIYTTALPPAVAAATLASLKIVRQESWRRDKLVQLVTRFRRGAEQIGLQLGGSNTPIQPVLINNDAKVMQVGQSLRDAGFLVGAIRPPTVPVGTGRLRITFSADHSEEQVDQLVAALDSLNLRAAI
ncbi:8-amino-7-oxononanoate synthase [marine gamma proteobacterium HTCC2207]|jgi:8-amino-7-oxononanoate synthase|uniref:8-amino-7-oxononanoate synthase n=1 Tax=gamma proteobacterium HTCC2207 TaxID=314287 RepID=Q1YQZ9_9GAMM|nr:8-amino-7-oxononanoate synthase [marine gamma proteobacterium HTCC2207] [gamma proteobacterium HTCC2207]MBT6593805.1 8-amino-7-oxononanoate synthase [Porticoccaceae bacterium]